MEKSRRKIIAAINMTLDGYCDHSIITPDENVHQHYTDLLSNADVILYGRITYQLMQYWQNLVENPSGEKSMDEFAIAMDRIPKIVFSRTLKNTGWKSAKLASRDIYEEVLELKHSPNGGSKDILVGSPGLIVTLLKLNLIDEYQLCVHPVIAGKGLPLFKNLNDIVILKFLKSKPLGAGAIILYYEPLKDDI